MTQTKDYILKDIKPLDLDTNIDKVQNLFKKFPFSHYPVIEKKLFLGNVSKEETEFISASNKKIRNIKTQLHSFYVTLKMNWFEVLQNFAKHNTNILPILDQHKKYIGYYELDDFLNLFKCTPFLHEEGLILVVSKDVNDYSFSEITQIVETNKATLLGAFISKIENNIAQITLKLSLHDINNTLNSFRRFNYQILNEFEKDKYLEELNDRSNYLQKYLNI